MHSVALQATMSKTSEDLVHDSHLQLQERMRNPIAFHAEMMGDIVYLQQVLRQPDAMEFLQAVIKEVNGHVDCNNWTLQKRYKVLEDFHIVPSVWALQVQPHNEHNQVTQGQVEPPWQKASLQNELF
jgi:hypothetical protein